MQVVCLLAALAMLPLRNIDYVAGHSHPHLLLSVLFFEQLLSLRNLYLGTGIVDVLSWSFRKLMVMLRWSHPIVVDAHSLFICIIINQLLQTILMLHDANTVLDKNSSLFFLCFILVWFAVAVALAIVLFLLILWRIWRARCIAHTHARHYSLADRSKFDPVLVFTEFSLVNRHPGTLARLIRFLWSNVCMLHTHLVGFSSLTVQIFRRKIEKLVINVYYIILF